MGALVAGLALAGGYRGDGSGHFAEAAPPASWAFEGARLKVDLPGTGNASPVRFGEQVCVAVEPTTTLCVQADTGVEAWRAEHPALAALPEAERAAVEGTLAAGASAEVELKALKAQQGDLERRSRAKDPASVEALAALKASIAALEPVVAASAPFRTPPSDPNMGWAAGTPATDGTSLYVSFANGVVAAHGPDGALRWTRWVGGVAPAMEFYPGLPTASVALAGDVVVVAHERLRGLDAATGAVRWEGPAWPHYGSPIAASVGGLPVLVTPAGDVIRAADGAVLASGLAHPLWFNAPVVAGDVVTWVGGLWQEGAAAGFRAKATSVRLKREGEGVVAERLWQVDVPSRDRFYAGPLVVGERVIAVDHEGRLFALDARTGALVLSRPLKSTSKGQVWASPSLAGGHVFVQRHDGAFLALDATTLTEVAESKGEPGHAAPLFDGARVWVRSHKRLWAI